MPKSVGVLALVVVACTIPPNTSSWDPACERTFGVSSDFPLTEKQALDRAVVRWNAIATEKFCLQDVSKELAENRPHGVFRIQYGSEYWKDIAKGRDVLGMHWSTSDQIGIVDVLSTELFEVVALHEFGHAHGLKHTQAPAIMYSAAGTAEDFTDLDREECKRVGACPQTEREVQVLVPAPAKGCDGGAAGCQMAESAGWFGAWCGVQ